MPINQSWSRILRMLVFVLLFVSTLTGLFLSDKLWTLWDVGDLPLWAALAPPVLFFLFMVVFALDRLNAVRARSLPAHRAMFHVGTSVLFFMLLLPHPTKNGLRRVVQAPQAADPILDEGRAARLLLDHRDRAVRAATCGLLGQTLQDGARPCDRALMELMAHRAQNDSAQSVREACQGALLQLTDGAAGEGAMLWPEPLGHTDDDDEPGCGDEDGDGSSTDEAEPAGPMAL